MELMAAQQYKAYEEQQKKKASAEEQEEMSMELIAAQKYKAYEEKQKKKVTAEEQEEMSLEQQAIQQYRAFVSGQAAAPTFDRQNSLQRALMEADNLLDAYAPPAPVPKPKKEDPVVFFPDSGTQDERNQISCILPGKLYLTNFRGVERLDELESLGIQHIVCVNEQENNFPSKFNYFNVSTLLANRCNVI